MGNTLRVVRGNPVGFCGYKADPATYGYKSYTEHPSHGSELPDEVDLSLFLPAPWNQGLTASGVAHAFAGAVTVALAAHSRALPSPAWPRGIYYATRLATLEASPGNLSKKASSPKPTTVSDIGSSPWWTIHLLKNLGIPTCRAETLEVDVRGEEYASFLLAKINENPTDFGLVSSPLDFHAIAEGDAKPNHVVSALATGYPILGAVDSSHPKFQSYNGTGVIDADVPTTKPGSFGYVPDQMVYIIAVRKGETGREFKIVNSWGWREWTHDSSAWVTERYVTLAISNLLVPKIL